MTVPHQAAQPDGLRRDCDQGSVAPSTGQMPPPGPASA